MIKVNHLAAPFSILRLKTYFYSLAFSTYYNAFDFFLIISLIYFYPFCLLYSTSVSELRLNVLYKKQIWASVYRNEYYIKSAKPQL